MRITKIFASAVILFFSLVNLSLATIWTHTVTMDLKLYGSNDPQPQYWEHLLPGGDFSVPPDTVNGASLDITARRATDGNDFIYYDIDLNDILLGFLEAGSGNSEEITSFDLVDLGVFSLISEWAAGDTVKFRLDYDQESGSNNYLTLEKSVFTLDYTSATASDDPTVTAAAVVPEPSTFLLLGLGLSGLAFLARRRRKE